MHYELSGIGSSEVVCLLHVKCDCFLRTECLLADIALVLFSQVSRLVDLHRRFQCKSALTNRTLK